MSEFNTYSQGFNDAKFDLNEGWIPNNYSAENIIDQLIVMIDPSEEYIEGYISAVFDN